MKSVNKFKKLYIAGEMTKPYTVSTSKYLKVVNKKELRLSILWRLFQVLHFYTPIKK
jgi:hypothetical protein